MGLIVLIRSVVERRSLAPGQILHELPGDSARACAAGHAPLDGGGFELFRLNVDAVPLNLTFDHVEIGLLFAGMEAKPQAEAVRQGNRFLDGFAGVYGGRAFIFDHVARH